MAPTRSFRWLLLTLAFFALTLDLGTKYGIFRWLYNDHQRTTQGAYETWTDASNWRDASPTQVHGGRYNLVPGWLGFTAEYDFPLRKPTDSAMQPLQSWSAPYMPRVNHGALFGLGGDHKDRANMIFAGVSLLAAVAILIWGMMRSNATDRWLCIALGLILGGTLGNFYDRIVFGGVRDFLYFYRVEWPVFNVADCGLVVGATMLLVQALFVPAKVEKPVTVPVAVEAR